MLLIFIPGDNDIGGEGSEPVKPEKVERFQRVYSNGTVWKLNKEIYVLDVNLITKSFPSKQEISANSNATRILISHFPVLQSYSSNQIIDSLNPTVIFSAHNHKSNEIVAEKNRHFINIPVSLDSFRIFDVETLKRNGKILEISVPTCSYRMGTFSIGYAQAVFDNDKLLYSPMFVISRFHQFTVYAMFLFILFIVNVGVAKRRKVHTKFERLI